jgi:hypothetical protein
VHDYLILAAMAESVHTDFWVTIATTGPVIILGYLIVLNQFGARYSKSVARRVSWSGSATQREMRIPRGSTPYLIACFVALVSVFWLIRTTYDSLEMLGGEVHHESQRTAILVVVLTLSSLIVLGFLQSIAEPFARALHRPETEGH